MKALITGASSGIGRDMAKYLSSLGYDLILVARNKEALEELQDELPTKVKAIVMDLAVESNVKSLYVICKNENIDVLINNAGLSDSASFLDYDVDRFDKIMNLNLRAVYITTHAAATIMKEQNHGVILNTSSMVSLYGQSAGVAYPVSKFAINGLTKSLARELGKYGIRVNAVAPGIINTDMVKQLPKEMIEPMINAIPLKRIGEPEDIASAFVFLASDNASYITGTILSVDGAMMS